MARNDTQITAPGLMSAKSAGRKIVALTAYDFTTASLVDAAGIDVVLVGDSLGTVIQGVGTTLPVTLDEMVYHCRCVSRGVRSALLVGDLPFMSYQVSIEKALESAGRLVKEGGVGAVKLEGGLAVEETIRRLVEAEIPVMGHVGLTPQAFHRMGGYKTQGKQSGSLAQAGSRERVLADAKAVETAGAFSVVLEGVPADLAQEITEQLSIPTIGIGAGPACDGQVLVVNDLLGLTLGKVPSFVRQYANLKEEISRAVSNFAEDVRRGRFPEMRESSKSEPVPPRTFMV